MNRKTLYNELSKVAKVRQLSNRENEITEPTLILSKKSLTGSTSNSLAGYQYWEVMCYVPSTSMLALDDLVNQVDTKLKSLDVELTFTRTPEFYDDVLKAYMISIEFRTIKTN